MDLNSIFVKFYKNGINKNYNATFKIGFTNNLKQ